MPSRNPEMTSSPRQQIVSQSAECFKEPHPPVPVHRRKSEAFRPGVQIRDLYEKRSKRKASLRKYPREFVGFPEATKPGGGGP